MERLKQWNISKRQLGLILYNNPRAYENVNRWEEDKPKIKILLDSISNFKNTYYCKPCKFNKVRQYGFRISEYKKRQKR